MLLIQFLSLAMNSYLLGGTLSVLHRNFTGVAAHVASLFTLYVH